MINMQINGRSTFLDLVIEGRRMDETIRTAIRDVAREYEAKLKVALQKPKSGKQYGGRTGRSYSRVRRKTVVFGKAVSYRAVVRTSTGRTAYRASAPGEAPAVASGSELRSIKVKFPAKQKGYGARVYADRGVAFYRHFLEFGTKERFMRNRKTGEAITSSHFNGRKRGMGGAGKSVGRIAPRPVFSPLQAELETALMARVTRAADLFVAFGGK